MPRAKPSEAVIEDEPDEQLDQTPETDTLTGAIPEGELALARAVASKMGWAPKEEWKRDPAKWQDAPDFLEQTPQVIARLKEQGERTAKAAAAAIEDAQRRDAEEATKVIRESDDPAAREAAAKKLRSPPPEVTAWVARNPWFNTDPDAHDLIVNATNRWASEGMTVARQLEEADKLATKRFPEYFSAGTEQRLSDVRRQAPNAPKVQEGSRPAQSQPAEKGWAQIPRADREAFDKHLLKAYTTSGKTADQAHARYATRYWGENVLPPDQREEDPWVKEKKSNPWGRR